MTRSPERGRASHIRLHESDVPARCIGCKPMTTINGGFVEAHYTYNPQFVLVGRYELVRMSRQANPSIAATAGTSTIGPLATVGIRS